MEEFFRTKAKNRPRIKKIISKYIDSVKCKEIILKFNFKIKKLNILILLLKRFVFLNCLYRNNRNTLNA